MRETYGVGLSDLGDALSWGEAKTIIEDASADPSTAFGAELAGWSYPATLPELFGLTAQIGNPKASEKVMPWVLKRPNAADVPSLDEIAIANAELEDDIVFS